MEAVNRDSSLRVLLSTLGFLVVARKLLCELQLFILDGEQE